MHRHRSIEWHEPPMHPNQHSSSLPGNVFQPLVLDAPVVIRKKLEERAAVRPYIVLVHSELIKLQLLPGAMMISVAEFQQRGRTRLARNKSEFLLYFCVGNGPGVAQKVERIGACD